MLPANWDNHSPFHLLTIKGTTTGVVANAEGIFSIDVKPGKYILICQHIGYFSTEVTVTVGNADVNININLPLQQYNLGSVNGAFRWRKSGLCNHSQGNKKTTAIRARNKGAAVRCVYQRQDTATQSSAAFFRTKSRTAGYCPKPNLFLIGNIARYSRQEPDKEKVEVLSTRVSGNSDGYGLSAPQIISFYHNNINDWRKS